MTRFEGQAESETPAFRLDYSAQYGLFGIKFDTPSGVHMADYTGWCVYFSVCTCARVVAWWPGRPRHPEALGHFHRSGPPHPVQYDMTLFHHPALV